VGEEGRSPAVPLYKAAETRYPAADGGYPSTVSSAFLNSFFSSFFYGRNVGIFQFEEVLLCFNTF
jgi:hypothetical protein